MFQLLIVKNIVKQNTDHIFVKSDYSSQWTNIRRHIQNWWFNLLQVVRYDNYSQHYSLKMNKKMNCAVWFFFYQKHGLNPTSFVLTGK